MSDEYTPRTEDMFAAWVRYRLDPEHFGSVNFGRGDAVTQEAVRWLAAHDAEVRATALGAAVRTVESMRPEMGPHINVTQYRAGKDDAFAGAALAINALIDGLSAYRPVAAHPEVESK